MISSGECGGGNVCHRINSKAVMCDLITALGSGIDRKPLTPNPNPKPLNPFPGSRETRGFCGRWSAPRAFRRGGDLRPDLRSDVRSQILHLTADGCGDLTTAVGSSLAGSRETRGFRGRWSAPRGFHRGGRRRRPGIRSLLRLKKPSLPSLPRPPRTTRTTRQ